MNILVINEYFAPVQEIASKRWSKIIKYIKKNQNVKITVLTSEKNYTDFESVIPISNIDPLLKKEEQCIDEYIYAKYDSLWLKYLTTKKKIYKGNEIANTEVVNKSFLKYKLFATLKQILSDMFQKRLGKIAYKSIKKNLNDYDVVISSYGPLWVHYAAEKIKKKDKNIRWFADFRDPIAKETDNKISFQYHKHFVRWNCRKAEKLIKVSENLELYESRKQVTTVITNGYDPDEIIECPNSNVSKFNIAFTGWMYDGKRDISIVAKAISELIKERKALENDVLFQYAGKEGDIFAKQVTKWGLDNVECLGLIPRDKAIELQNNACILLQANWNTKLEQGEWSGKMYEYMVTKKPIVFCMSGDEPYSYASKNMHRLGGICYEYCRDEELYPLLKEYIENKYFEWKNTGNVSVSVDEEYLKSFSVETIAEQVWNMINE